MQPLQIVPARPRLPTMRGCFFGPVGSWKTSTLALVEKAVWLDFHGSTSVLPMQPASVWDPASNRNRPSTYPDLVDVLKGFLVADIRAAFNAIVFDGLDDIERMYLIPEALRRCDAKTLGDNFWAPARMLLALHVEFKQLVEQLWLFGYAVFFTCHDQILERINPDGNNYQVVDLSLFYQGGKTGNINCPAIWRDWFDFCIYLSTTGRTVKQGVKDKIGKAVGDPDQHVAYIRAEGWLDSVKARGCEEIKSPHNLDSPEQLWNSLRTVWALRYTVDADLLRVEVARLVETFITSGRTKNPEAARKMLLDCKTVEDLHLLASKVR